MAPRVILLVLALSAIAIAVMPLRSDPKVIHPSNLNGTVQLNIHRGGAIVQPLLPINNSVNTVNITFNITGQACDLDDPLVFFYRPLFTNGSTVLLVFPSDFFFLNGCCGNITTLILNNSERWNIQFAWDGRKFVSQPIAYCCA
jgi:hypothetical protein